MGKEPLSRLTRDIDNEIDRLLSDKAYYN